MWHKRSDRPLPALRDGDEIELTLEFHQYYGHDNYPGLRCVVAVWDGLNEEFFEKETKQYILDEDIHSWWENEYNPMKNFVTKAFPTETMSFLTKKTYRNK